MKTSNSYKYINHDSKHQRKHDIASNYLKKRDEDHSKRHSKEKISSEMNEPQIKENKIFKNLIKNANRKVKIKNGNKNKEISMEKSNLFNPENHSDLNDEGLMKFETAKEKKTKEKINEILINQKQLKDKFVENHLINNFVDDKVIK